MERAQHICGGLGQQKARCYRGSYLDTGCSRCPFSQSNQRRWATNSVVPHRTRSGVCSAQNPGGSNKEDAARKALQEMFKGKSDTLAAFDTDGRGGSGGSKGPGGGGGGGKGGWSDWQGWFSNFGRQFSELGKALQAILAFAAIMLAFCYLGDAISFVTGTLTIVLRWLLRLDARKAPMRTGRQLAIDSQLPDASPAHLGSFERRVMQKYGPAPAFAHAGDKQ